jgi:hypothetical protein
MAEVLIRRRCRGLRFYTGLLKLLGVLCLAASVLVLVVGMTLNAGKNAPDFVLTLLVTVAILLSGPLLLANAQGCEASWCVLHELGGAPGRVVSNVK